MDNRDDEDDKRRVMTPPAEWGGADDNDDLLGGDIDWLSEPEESDQADEVAEDASTNPPLSAPADSNAFTAEPADSLESDLLSSTETDPVTTESAGDGETDSWLDSDPTTAEESTSIEPVITEESIGTVGETSEDELTTLAMAPPVEEDEDNWLDTPETGFITPPPETPDSPVAIDTEESRTTSLTQADAQESASTPTEDGWITANNSEHLQEGGELNGSGGQAVSPNEDNWLTEEPEPTGPMLQSDSGTKSADKEQTPSSEDLLTDHRVATDANDRKLPIWPIVAVVVALVLLGTGGWGAYSERAALQAQVQSLTNQLNQKRSQGNLSAAEEQELRADNQSMRLQLATLREQYAAMSAEIQGLEQRLMVSLEEGIAQETSAISQATSEDSAASESQSPADDISPTDPVAAPTKTTTAEVNTAVNAEPRSGTWFVNIASYSRRDTAEDWANKVRKDGNSVSLQEVVIKDRTLYRVRAEGFNSKSEAQEAAGQFQTAYKTGPLWVGMNDPREPARSIETNSSSSKPALEGLGDTDEVTPVDSAQAKAKEPVALPSGSGSSTGGWFIYVDTYSKGTDADEKAKVINNAGYEAKVAVEYRSGELFYRVQVVGINDREAGEQTVKELAAIGDMPNLQLRQY